jgi:RNase P subunit RPR2
MKKFSKTEVEKKIKDFFGDIEDKTPKEVKKIKKLAMSQNISLKELKKKFCKKCFSPLGNSKVRIRNEIKSVKCKNCGQINRWKIKKNI